MEARISELIMLAGSIAALAAAMLLLPCIEKREERAVQERGWAIIDGEFVEFKEAGNG